MGVGMIEEAWRLKKPRYSWIFIHGADKVEGGLIVLIFGLVFPVDSLEIFLPTPLSLIFKILID